MPEKSSMHECTAKKTLKTTMVLFFAIVTAVFVFMMTAIFLNESNGPLVAGLNKHTSTIMWITGIVSLVCLVAARKILWKGLTTAKNSLNPLQSKLTQYRASLIRYLVICEMPALLSVILFMLTGDFIFLAFSAVFLGFMLAAAPVRRRVITALDLNGSEQQELE